MLRYFHCRPGNIIQFEREYLVEILFCSKTNIGFIDPRSGKEKSCFFDSDTISGAPITEQLITNKLHWVAYKGPDYSDDRDVKELTEGRIIVRLNPESVTVFQPNNFPWAKNIGLHMDFVTSITFLHELQNIYADIFKEEMDIEDLVAR